jgi:hypothetical protein
MMPVAKYSTGVISLQSKIKEDFNVFALNVLSPIYSTDTSILTPLTDF